MGQYYHVVNISKKEFLNPHRFGNGLKLMEFGMDGMSTMTGLALLLADGNGRGGGDMVTDPVSEIIGRWKGDRIVIVSIVPGEGITKKDVEGLTDEDGNPIKRQKINLNGLTNTPLYKDISHEVLFAMLADSYIRAEFQGSCFGSDKNIITDFKKIHEQLAKNSNDLSLLIGQLTTTTGKEILEKFLKQKGETYALHLRANS